MKRITMMTCAVAMAVTLAACSTANSTEDSQTDNTTQETTVSTATANTEYAGTTVVGQITAIDGSNVTLQLGELTEPDMGEQKPDGETPQGEAPDENGSQDQNGDTQTPPEKPEGEEGQDTSDGQAADTEKSGVEKSQEGSDSEASDAEKPEDKSADDQTPPEMPDGEVPQGEAPEGGMSNFTAGDTSITVDLTDTTITKNDDAIGVEDLSEDDLLQITFDEDGVATEASVVTQSGPQGEPGGFGGSGEVTQGSSANTISEDGTFEEESYESTGDDENALRIDNAEVTLNNITVNKSAGSSSNTEDGDFYGMNAALLATNGANVTIKNATVTSSAQNGNGVFSYGSGTVVNIEDSTITTTADNSGGIQTTGGGTTNASNLTVETSGNSSAAIRSDRGGGTVNVDGGAYTSNGYNSPAVYSTAAIEISDATLIANSSEALVIEGSNSITLNNCTVYGNMSDTEGSSSDENVHNVMIYQSMSGDAEVGTSLFSMTDGSLTSDNGDLFYITNTACEIDLSGVEISNLDKDSYLMNICGNSASKGWGIAGANGAQVVFTASNQELNGDIVVDTISTLDMTLKDNSTFTGTINIVDNEENGTAVSDNADITIESGSTWTLTGDCTVSTLTNNGTINYNGYTITLADGTVLS